MKTSVQKLLTIMCVVLLTGSANAQVLDEFPRTPDGKPDFSGIWQAMTNAHYDIEPHAAAYGPYPREMGALSAKPADLGIVEGGRIPYNEQARRVADQNRVDAITKDPLAKCFMPGIPRANYLPFPFQIVQSSDIILIAYEFAESNRIVYVDQPEIVSQVDAWMGHSNAHWEGDTLVVSVTGQMQDTWFDRVGNHHSFQMVVEERWTPAGPNHVNYSATITDPNTFTQPWTVSFPLYRHVREDMQLLEFKCVEFAEEYMYGEWRKEGTPIGNPPE
ncbi:MAG: hypothetical protein OXU66_05205 [Gammaproteobacteria bacterium]|nr:hypothetical protein [Gammaproteobacteria bacterium]MDD9894768.1 hypothetical protein [Gammaproteobacteria bacterium]MDD9958320.1 hypothetical protein [Gammaproteobacteria bacterium]